MLSFPKEAVRINFALYSGDFSSPAGWSHLSCAILSRISSSERPSYWFFPAVRGGGGGRERFRVHELVGEVLLVVLLLDEPVVDENEEREEVDEAEHSHPGLALARVRAIVAGVVVGRPEEVSEHDAAVACAVAVVRVEVTTTTE